MGLLPMIAGVEVVVNAMSPGPELLLCSKLKLALEKLAVARSRLPSPSKSAMTTERGPAPGSEIDVGVKVKLPAPALVLRRTVTLLSVKLATAMSGLLSPSRSPMAVQNGPAPT